MKKTIRTAVIGAGNMGKNHMRIYSKISNLVAIVDVNSKIGEPLAKRYHTKFYSNYMEMLKKEKPEAISIVTPTRLHEKIGITCLSQGIPILIEKPIANTVKAAQKILKAAKKNKTFLMVGHIERFNPAVIMLKKLLENNDIGKIINLLAIRVGINPPNAPGSDVALDLAIHDVDIFNFLLNQFPKTKKVIKVKLYKQNIADSASILLGYSNATGIIYTNWITPIKTRLLRVSATKGYAELDYISQRLIVYKKIDPKINNSSDMMLAEQGVKKEVYVSKREPLEVELNYFLHNIHNKKNDNLYALKALEIVTQEVTKLKTYRS